MKKITFIFFALIAGTGFAQNNATGTATVNAEIVSPISITEVGSALDFGKLIGSELGGIVTVSTGGDRTGNDNLLAPGGTPTAAVFNVKAALDFNYKITIDDIVLSAADADDMAVTFTSGLGNESSGTGENQILNVGGALTLNANQAEGDYTGTVSVTVAYE